MTIVILVMLGVAKIAEMPVFLSSAVSSSVFFGSDSSKASGIVACKKCWHGLSESKLTFSSTLYLVHFCSLVDNFLELFLLLCF